MSNTTLIKSKLTEEEIQELLLAKRLLENPGFAVKITSFLGSPLEVGLEKLPKNWHEKIGEVTKTALMKAVEAAAKTINDEPGKASSNYWHKLGAAVSGGVGGFFGLTALAIELPISTTIMFRSIADIARSQGESINDFETKLACLEVFALGGGSSSDDSAESAYFLARAMLANSVGHAAAFVAKKGASTGAPLMVKFLSKIAERFSLQITEKAAAQGIPIVGAAGGAIINSLFIDHFQDMAKGHFIVRKLQKKYGDKDVELLYRGL